MSSGTMFAMSSTFAAFAAVVSIVGPEVSVFFVHPDNARVPDSDDHGQAAPPSRTPPTGLVSSFHVASSFCIGSSSAAQSR